jgi:hypothetical protein
MAKAAGGRQMSRKAGLVSSAQKAEGSRHGFDTQPASRKVAGASGSEGRSAAKEPGTATRKKGMAAALRSMKTTSRRTGKTDK